MWSEAFSSKSARAASIPRPPERFCTEKIWLEHCLLTGSGVRFRSTGKSKGNFRSRRDFCVTILGFIAGSYALQGLYRALLYIILS